MKKFKKIIIGLIVVILLGLGFAGNYFYEYAIMRKDQKVEQVDERIQANQNWFNQNAVEVKLDSVIGKKVQGYEFKNSQSKDWVIVVHGHKTNALRMSNYVKGFHNLGYNVLAIDLIGHGKSEGYFYSMGGLDSKDLTNWVKYLSNQYSNPNIALFGISMGGATVMNSLDENLPSNVKLFIEDSGYIKVEEVFAFQLNAQFKIPAFPFIPLAGLATQLRAGYSLNEVDAPSALKNNKLPALIIHGEEDDYVPIEYSKQIMQLLTSEKEFVTFKDAKHCKSEDLHTEAYWSTIYQFLHKYFK